MELSRRPGKKASMIHTVLPGQRLMWKWVECVSHGATIPGSAGLGRSVLQKVYPEDQELRVCGAGHQQLGRRGQKLTNEWGGGARS